MRTVSPFSPTAVRRPRLFTALASAVLLLLLAAPAGAVEWSSTLEARARGELFRTPSASPALDDSYQLGLGRVRFVVDATHQRWTFHGALQGAAMAGLPEDGAFGIGPVYLAANDGDDRPRNLGFLELSATWSGDVVSLVLGRQPWADGFETGTGVPELDAVKRARLAERLVGNWDWVNVGRRYDGGSAKLDGDGIHGAFFLFHPLAGGVEYDNAFEPLDDLTVGGATATLEYGTWFPGEARLFAILYDDERPGARAAAGGPVEIDTLGASLLLGDAGRDVLLWGAWQSGDWGRLDHSGWAGIVEAGWRLDGAGEPEIRFGVARASGDEPNGGHEAFFNLLPTNHKWYGAMDYNAFSNLLDVYALGRRGFGPWTVSAELHHFSLVEKGDGWYGGSGAFDEAPLGYARRRGSGRFPATDLGWELDLTAARAVGEWKLAGGASYFLGRQAAEHLLREDADGAWAFFQVSRSWDLSPGG